MNNIFHSLLRPQMMTWKITRRNSAESIFRFKSIWIFRADEHRQNGPQLRRTQTKWSPTNSFEFFGHGTQTKWSPTAKVWKSESEPVWSRRGGEASVELVKLPQSIFDSTVAATLAYTLDSGYFSALSWGPFCGG